VKTLIHSSFFSFFFLSTLFFFPLLLLVLSLTLVHWDPRTFLIPSATRSTIDIPRHISHQLTHTHTTKNNNQQTKQYIQTAISKKIFTTTATAITKKKILTCASTLSLPCIIFPSFPFYCPHASFLGYKKKLVPFLLYAGLALLFTK